MLFSLCLFHVLRNIRRFFSHIILVFFFSPYTAQIIFRFFSVFLCLLLILHNIFGVYSYHRHDQGEWKVYSSRVCQRSYSRRIYNTQGKRNMWRTSNTLKGRNLYLSYGGRQIFFFSNSVIITLLLLIILSLFFSFSCS